MKRILETVLPESAKINGQVLSMIKDGTTARQRKSNQVQNEKNQHAFNSKANRDKKLCILVEAEEYTEGVSFYGCTNFILINPPATWTMLKQLYGRVQRSCRAPVGCKSNLWVAITKNGLSTGESSPDEVRLESIKLQRNDIEKTTENICANAIGASLLYKGLQMEPVKLTNTLEEEPVLLRHNDYLNTYTDFIKNFKPTGTGSRKLKSDFYSLLCQFNNFVRNHPRLQNFPIVKIIQDRFIKDKKICQTSGKVSNMPKKKKTKKKKIINSTNIS